MLPFDKEFQTGEAKITQVRLDVLLMNNTILNLTEEQVMLGGFIRDTSTTVDGEFTVGAAVTGKLTVQIDNTDQSLSRYDFRGAIITASLGGESSHDVFQLLQVGIYTVDDYSYDGSVITLTAYDDFYKFDEPCSDSSVTFPITLENFVRQACAVAEVPLANTTIPNGDYSITKQPAQWDTMTWHDVVAYCAQIACCYAKILPDGRLFFSWYDTALFNEDQLDGGSFSTTTTPYSDGGIADGGDFYYNSGADVDGGVFGDRDNDHVLSHLFDITVDTDDVLITGVSVTLDPSDNINADQDTEEYVKTLGTDDYMIKVENNPLIETTANADAVCSYLYSYIVGMRFRSLDATILENPAVEAGDSAIVVDRHNNTYACFISHATYTTGASTRISCDAESPMHNLKARYSEVQKTRALTQRTFERSVMSADAAMQMIMSAYATTMGLYQFTEPDGHGGTVYVYGNKSTLASSNIRWKLTAGAVMVSSNYGRTWNAAISSEGIAVFQEVYAMKISADNIVTGTMTIGGTSGNKDGSLIIKDASGNVIGTFNKNGISVKGSIVGGSRISGAEIYGSELQTARIFMNQNYTEHGGIFGYSSNTYNLCTMMITDDEIASSNFYSAYNQQNVSVIEFEDGRLLIGKGYIDVKDSRHPSTAICSGNLLMMYDEAAKFGGGNYDSIYIRFDGDGESSSYYSSMSTARVGFKHNNNYYPHWFFEYTLYCQNLVTFGNKNKAVDTNSYGTRLAYCYEMPSPMFGDIGSAMIGDDGTVLIEIDPIFQECVYEKGEYYVFLQNEGRGESYISEKTPTYFIISGTPGLKVAWEMKAKQADTYWLRNEELTNASDDNVAEPDYAEDAFEYVMDYLNGGTE